eukprot:TRINITY_DN7995_c0_g2_i1.p1 TRINITY_DN7995_c0_g2~~TRINITY_DN7995_c0_g2_i1.p1  ORF type:complete len:253 (-),score=31.32 TRINITY_DN7995_c0_g2_i1:128-886(-)
MKCTGSVLKLSIRKDDDPRLINICVQPETIWSLLPLLILVTFMLENFRRLFSDIRTQGIRKLGVIGVLVVASSVFPIWYNHEVLFLYINDKWYNLIHVQAFFTLTDDICLVLRWADMMPELRAAVHLIHIGFNVLVELNFWGGRNICFLVDDVIALTYAILRAQRAKEIKRQKASITPNAFGKQWTQVDADDKASGEEDRDSSLELGERSQKLHVENLQQNSAGFRTKHFLGFVLATAVIMLGFFSMAPRLS